MLSRSEVPPWQSVECELAYPVLVGTGARSALAKLLEPFPHVVCLVDRRVSELHAEALPQLDSVPKFLVEPGEENKTWQHLERVSEFLASADCSRQTLMITVGGGATSDLGGLSASLFKRGIKVAHLPTTLLAQVDAAIGGKTGINLPQGKNLIGTFYAPQFVIADTDFLATLEEAEWHSGLGEVVKSALLARPPLWRRLQDVAQNLTSPTTADPEALAEIIRGCVLTKAQWVQTDPLESGSRKALNLGHTFGHAIEHAAGFGAVPHGVAVSMGLVLAMEASQKEQRLRRTGLAHELVSVLTTLGLPSRWDVWAAPEAATLTPESLTRSLAHDKKGAVADPRFVLPIEEGRVIWDYKLSAETVQELWNLFLSKGKAKSNR